MSNIFSVPSFVKWHEPLSIENGSLSSRMCSVGDVQEVRKKIDYLATLEKYFWACVLNCATFLEPT